MFRFFSSYRRKKKKQSVKPGDNHELKPYQFWHIFTHSLFHIDITDTYSQERTSYSIKSKYYADESSVDVYKNKRHIAYSKLPAIIPVEEGDIEIGYGDYGINRIHVETNRAVTYTIRPDKRSIRGMRMWLHSTFPKVSSFLGLLAVITLLTSIVLGLPQLIESLTAIPWVEDNIGTFTSPITLPAEINYGLVGLGILAGIERTLMLRSHWLIDMETNHWDQ